MQEAFPGSLPLPADSHGACSTACIHALHRVSDEVKVQPIPALCMARWQALELRANLCSEMLPVQRLQHLIALVMP